MARIADPDWVVKQLKTFLKSSESTSFGPSSWAYKQGTSEATVTGMAQIVEQIIWTVLPDWEFEESSQFEEPWRSHRVGAMRAITQIQFQDTLDKKLGNPSPKLDAESLHPWVWESAQVAWSAGSFGDAVRAAARAINAKARQKLGRKNAGEWKLLQNAFSIKPPAVGEPRFRLMSDETDETFVSLHTGAGALAQGLFMAVRNPANHEDGDEPPEQLALEQLAAFSILARFIDEAVVVHA